MKILLLSSLVVASAFAQCGANGMLIINPLTGLWDCTGAAGAGSGTVTSIATTSPITGGTITATGTIACGTCVTSSVTQTADRILKGNGTKDTVVSGASIDSSDKGAFPGGIDLGTGSGKTGYQLMTGKTSGSAGFTVADAAGTQILYMLPTSTGSTNDVLSDTGSATCPDMSAGAPTNCHQLAWHTPSAGGAGVTPTSYGSLPSCTSTAAMYTLTNSYYQLAYCDGSSTYHFYIDGKEVTRPAAASSWTVVNGNSGIAAKSDSVGAVVLSTTASVNGLETLLKAVPSAPYIKTFLLSGLVYGQTFSSTGSVPQIEVMWADGTTTSSSTRGIRFAYNGPSTGAPIWLVTTYTSYTFAGETNSASGVYPIAINMNRLWIQFEDNNTNRFFRISNDGINWLTVFSEGRTSPFTPTHYGFGAAIASGSGTGAPWYVALISDVTQ